MLSQVVWTFGGRPRCRIFAAFAALSLPLVSANHQSWPEDHRSENTTAPLSQLMAAAFAVRLAPTIVWSTALYGVYTYLGVGLTSLGFSAHEIARTFYSTGAGRLSASCLAGE
jgi:predicted MFS family arabinose efflux permease